MKNKICRGITFDEDLFHCIDKERGLIKRSTFVNNALRKALMKE